VLRPGGTPPLPRGYHAMALLPGGAAGGPRCAVVGGKGEPRSGDACDLMPPRELLGLYDVRANRWLPTARAMAGLAPSSRSSHRRASSDRCIGWCIRTGGVGAAREAAAVQFCAAAQRARSRRPAAERRPSTLRPVEAGRLERHASARRALPDGPPPAVRRQGGRGGGRHAGVRRRGRQPAAPGRHALAGPRGIGRLAPAVELRGRARAAAALRCAGWQTRLDRFCPCTRHVCCHGLGDRSRGGWGM